MNGWTWVILQVGVLTDAEKTALEAAAAAFGTNQKIATLRRNADGTKVLANVPNALLPKIRRKAIVSQTVSDDKIRATMATKEWAEEAQGEGA